MKNYLYEYQALDNKGEMTSGHIKGQSDAEAIMNLRAMGLYPTKVNITKDNPFDEKSLRPTHPSRTYDTKKPFELTPSMIFYAGVTVGFIVTYLCTLLQNS